MYRSLNRLLTSKCNYCSMKLLFSNKHKLIYETNVCKSFLNTLNSRNELLSQKHVKRLPFDQRVVYFSNAKNEQKLKLKTEKNAIEEKLESVLTKKRSLRKKVNVQKSQQLPSVLAFSTAEEYNLEELSEALKEQGLYELLPFEDVVENVVHLGAKYEVNHIRRELFIFREGSIVFWNMPSVECEAILKFVKRYEISAYDEIIVNEEKEEMDFDYIDNSKTKLQKGSIYLNTNSIGDSALEKYAFSDAIALSVKLAIWEASLHRYVNSIEYVSEDMKEGKKIKLTRDQVFSKTGELFNLKHRINLSSDLLDTPDFYWDRQELEKLFMDTYYHLNINKRTKVMNEKLNHCLELMELLSSHLNDIHHVRLEWMIIILIMVEVVFEFIHYAERLF